MDAIDHLVEDPRPATSFPFGSPDPWSDHPGATWTSASGTLRRAVGHYGDKGPFSSGAATTGDDVTSV